MKGTRQSATARHLGLLPLVAVFVASLAASWAWLGFDRHEPATRGVKRDLQTPAAAAEQSKTVSVLLDAPASQRKPELLAAMAGSLPPEHLASLVEAGITADDSEQRSLAILELAQAPVEQSLPGLARILRENRDQRSRKTALEVLMRLPDSVRVRDERQHLLELLSRDPDTNVAEAARTAAATSG